MENRLYWLWLTLKESLGPRKICELANYYGSAEAVYKASDYEKAGIRGRRMLSELADKSMERAESVIRRMDAIGGYILTIDDEEYPSMLKNIYAPPCVLYAMGEHLDWDNLFTISIVGTRKYTNYGRRVAQKLAREMAQSGITVVSGMARGIDSIAGEAALDAGAKTVAVLGSGVDVVYPSEFVGLYNRIKSNGVVISEFPPGTRPFGKNFPQRNRIMAGLSYGTLVVQAPIRSGALITAAHAINNNRDVFVVPGDIFDINQEGTNALLNVGAKAVTCVGDILEEYPFLINKNSETYRAEADDTDEEEKQSRIENIDLTDLDKNEIAIVKALDNRSVHMDVLIRELDMNESEIGASLIMLEISGIVRKKSGNIYELV